MDDISLLDVRRCEHRVSGESCVHGQDQVEEWLADHWITQHGENSGTKTLNIKHLRYIQKYLLMKPWHYCYTSSTIHFLILSETVFKGPG